MSSTEPTKSTTGEYVFNSESATEMARLLLQDRLINEAMNGLLPEQSPEEIEKIRYVLDVGSGPGAWTLDLALTYPHMHVKGIDISETMISYAQMQQKAHKLDNIEFIKMDALQERLPFGDQTQDLVNIRNAVGYVMRSRWPALLKECYRILRPDGILRLTEADTMGLTNSKAYERHHYLGSQVMQELGYGFAPSTTSLDVQQLYGTTLGITPVLGKLLRDQGYHDINLHAHMFDFSYNAPLYSSHTQNIKLAFKASQPLLLRSGKISQADLERLYQEVVTQLDQENFRGLNYFLTASGRR